MRTGKPNKRVNPGRSRSNNWSCRVLVAVEIMTRLPLSNAGTKYAKVLPTPVPASTTKAPPASMRSAIATAI